MTTEPTTEPTATTPATDPDAGASTVLRGILDATVADRPSVAKAFGALLWRDLFVTGKQGFAFVAQVLIQPVFMLFVFGRILGDIGFTQGNYADVFFPGVLALLSFLGAFQNTLLPLVIDFSLTKEIEDRLLAPLPIHLVAIEKMLFSAIRALVAVTMVFPLAYLILGSLPVSLDDLPVVFGFLAIGSLAGAAFGLALGTVVEASKVNMVFAILWPPLMFTGSIQYPWMALDDLRWFQVLSAFNPVTYVSEGLRGQMLDDVVSMPFAVSVSALFGMLVVLTIVGILGFRRRALD